MKIKNRGVTLLLIIIVFTSFIYKEIVYSADYACFKQDLGLSGSTTEIISPPIQTIWRETIGATKSYPIIVGDKLYIGTSWALVCYNAKWGTKIWQYISKDFFHSTPAYYAGFIYCGYTNYIYCIDAKTGLLKWKYNTGKDSINSSPIVFSNTVFFASNNKLYALSYNTGNVLWSIGFPSNIEFPISIASDKFFVIAGNRCYGFNFKTHSKIWEYELPEKIKYCFSASNKNVFVSNGKEIYAIDTQTGKLNWKQFFAGNAMNSPSYFGNDVFASFDQYLYCLDGNNGKIKWQFEAGFLIESTPSISEKYVWVGADDFNLYCIDRNNGKKLFEAITGSTSQYVVVGNKQIFSTSAYGDLFSFAPTVKKNINVKFELWIGKKYVRNNGKFMNIDAPPFIENGKTMVPIRAIGEALGAELKWDANAKKVTYTIETRFIELWIGNSTAYVSGKKVKLDVPPRIVDGRAFVPLRFVSENLGARVSWDPTEKRVTIEYP